MPLRGAVVQSLKVRQMRFLLHRPALQDIERQFGIGQHHAAEADEVGPALADHGLRDVREELLQVRVAASPSGRNPGMPP